jgi:hypothetical protein
MSPCPKQKVGGEKPLFNNFIPFGKFPFLNFLRLIIFRRINSCRCQWPSGLRRGSAADRLLLLRVRSPPGVWMFVLL